MGKESNDDLSLNGRRNPKKACENPDAQGRGGEFAADDGPVAGVSNRPRLEGVGLACPAERGGPRTGRPRWGRVFIVRPFLERLHPFLFPTVFAPHAVPYVRDTAKRPSTSEIPISILLGKRLRYLAKTARRNGGACQGRTAGGRGFRTH
jgi:hypothetical protein